MSDTTITPENSVIHHLTDRQLDMIFFIERYHASQGTVPDDAKMHRRFDLFEGELDAFKANPLVARSFEARGIHYPSRGSNLSDRQMAAVATMLDNYDKRSDEKKLRDIGITTREWSQWLLDDEFGAYLRDRSERMLVAAQFEAHKGLIKGARTGNVASIKELNALTGRRDPEADNNINVTLMVHRFIEVIQREVKDPQVMHRIANELVGIATGGGAMSIRAQARPALTPAPEDDV